MPKTKQRPSAVTIVSKDALEQAGIRLQELPDKPKEFWSLREAVAILQEDITDALNRGYTYDEIVKLLAGKNISITASSLKRYLATARREGNAKTRKPRKPRNQALAVTQAMATTPSAATFGAQSAQPQVRKTTTTRSAAKAAPVSKSRAAVGKKASSSTTGKRGRNPA
ncbi:MAG: hypothetical protein IGS54_07445 [Elainella sp. C42_A2020_010]|nr:hypothetical protein [Elainella sp. C42_A2020_010]